MDIDIAHLTYRCKEKENLILDDINLQIAGGEWILISGCSGSGKTTLAYAIAGILYHQQMGVYEGNVRIDELNIEETPLYGISDSIGFVQQNADDQFCALNVADELAFGLENKCIAPEEMKKRIADALKITGAESLYTRQLFELSGGEKQKVAIASILALQPSILILDEPTSNLDLESTHAIFDVLKNLQQTTNLTVIIIEHKVHLFTDLFKRCIHIENGKILYDGVIEKSPFYHVHLNTELSHPGKNIHNAISILSLHDWIYENGGGFRLKIEDLEIKQGEIIALMGANGSGKTTLFKTITGMVHIQQGQMKFNGERKEQLTSPQIGLVFQNADDQIFMNTVQDEVFYGLKNFHMDNSLHTKKAQELLEFYGLIKKINDNPHQLSYGEKKRLNLISTLVFSPSLLLLDEIFIGQDIYQVDYILEKLKYLRESGLTIITAIHDPTLMKKIADRILFLEDGNMRFCLPLQEAVIWWQVNGYGDYLPEKDMGL
ncbi:MAG: ABC transporter ATP-binding protein [Anaerolineaceae bacterium]